MKRWSIPRSSAQAAASARTRAGAAAARTNRGTRSLCVGAAIRWLNLRLRPQDLAGVRKQPDLEQREAAVSARGARERPLPVHGQSVGRFSARAPRAQLIEGQADGWGWSTLIPVFGVPCGRT